MKKVISMLLIVAMMMSLSVCAFAADTTTVEALGKDNTVTGSSDVTFTGKVQEASVLLSVVMPTTIEFTVATKNYEGTDKLAASKGTLSVAPSAVSGKVFNALMSGEGTVTNNSNVAIDLEITNVTEDSNLLSQIDFAVKSSSMTASAALANPLSVGSANIALASAIAAAGGTTTLKAVGQAATATHSGTNYEVSVVDGTYTITTTLKVSVYSAS